MRAAMRTRLYGMITAVLCGLAGTAAPPAAAGTQALSLGGRPVAVAVRSIREARFTTVIRQRYDFSCGSAAAATLLSHHYGRPISEEQAFERMFTVGDQAAIQRRGFSLLDIQRLLASQGLKADGFRIGLDDVRKIGLPAIALIVVKGYRHFVVIKGVDDREVLVGDPAAGLRVYGREAFDAAWDHVAFIIRDDPATGRANFNRRDEWTLFRRAPVAAALDRGALGPGLLLLPGMNEF